MSKPERDTDEPEKIFSLLSRRFGTGIGRAQIRNSFMTREQRSDENLMQILDALESLRSKGYPEDTAVSRRYEIMQRFIQGVQSSEFHRVLVEKFSEAKFMDDPPTEEELRFLAQEYSRLMVARPGCLGLVAGRNCHGMP